MMSDTIILKPKRPKEYFDLKLKTLLCLSIIVALLTSPITASALFSEMTVTDELEMGREFDKKIRQLVPIIEDPMIHDYVEGVVQRVYKTMPPQPFRLTTTVIAHGSMNAFAVPGGFVYVFTGLLAQLDTEDQLAAVISHELAHVSQRHVVDRMQKMEKVGIISMIGTLAGLIISATADGSAREVGQALTVGSQAASHAAFLTYTQENEREADHVGLNYLVEAGYNPLGMPETFDIMLKNQFRGRSSKLPNYLRTHPKLSERSNYLRNRIKSLSDEVRARQDTRKTFLKVRALIRGRLSNPTWSEATMAALPENQRTCYDYMAIGMVNARLKRDGIAKSAFEDALTCGANDPLILREAGAYYFKTGNFVQAQQYLQKSLFMNSQDIITLYYNARLMGEEGNYKDAIGYLKQVLEQLKTDSEVYYHLGRYQGADGDYFHAHLNLAYSALMANNMKQYKFHKEKASGLASTEDKKAKLEKLNAERKERNDD